jgi:hypothetical protein
VLKKVSVAKKNLTGRLMLGDRLKLTAIILWCLTAVIAVYLISI